MAYDLTPVPAGSGPGGHNTAHTNLNNAVEDLDERVEDLESTSGPGGGASALNDLTDVDTTGQTTGDVLKYNGTSWVADAASAADISDSTAVGRDVLTAADADAARTAIGAATPQQVTDGDTATLAAAQSHAQGLVDALTAASPATLDTLAEIADALGEDPNFAATMTAALAARVRHDAVQSLTVGEQAQARSNIGAGTSSFSGDYDDLTDKPTLGTAAATAATDYATAAQGALADTALQVASAQPINAQTGAYTLVAADAGKMVKMTLAAAADLTVPANVFTAGQRVDIADRGTHRVTVVAGAGMTVNPPAGGSLVMEGRYSAASLYFWSATEADLVGLVAAS